MNCTIYEKAWSMLSHAKLLKIFWGWNSAYNNRHHQSLSNICIGDGCFRARVNRKRYQLQAFEGFRMSNIRSHTERWKVQAWCKARHASILETHKSSSVIDCEIQRIKMYSQVEMWFFWKTRPSKILRTWERKSCSSKPTPVINYEGEGKCRQM